MAIVSKKNFKSFINIVLITVYILILIGGIVRSTGSGMGCPDWPTCFGKIVPPTDISELPADYKIQFAVKGREIADFNVIKTWTEYLNRLFGMLTGFFILLLAILAFSYRKSDKRIFWLAQLNLFAVIFQGWLGAVVVSTHLKPVIITLHMVMAIVIVFILLQKKKYLLEKESVALTLDASDYKLLSKLSLLVMAMTMIQVVIGTQVREAVDHVAKGLLEGEREAWLSTLGPVFYIHRSFSIVLVLLQGFFSYKLFSKQVLIPRLRFHNYGMIISITLSLVAGISLIYFHFPRSMQPLHLVAAVLLMGFQYTCFCDINLHRPTKRNRA